MSFFEKLCYGVLWLLIGGLCLGSILSSFPFFGLWLSVPLVFYGFSVLLRYFFPFRPNASSSGEF